MSERETLYSQVQNYYQAPQSNAWSSLTSMARPYLLLAPSLVIAINAIVIFLLVNGMIQYIKLINAIHNRF